MEASPQVAHTWAGTSRIPRNDAIRVYRRDGETFAPPRELTREAGDTLTTTVLPGLEIPLSRVFAT